MSLGQRESVRRIVLWDPSPSPSTSTRFLYGYGSSLGLFDWSPKVSGIYYNRIRLQVCDSLGSRNQIGQQLSVSTGTRTLSGQSNTCCLLEQQADSNADHVIFSALLGHLTRLTKT